MTTGARRATARVRKSGRGGKLADAPKDAQEATAAPGRAVPFAIPDWPAMSPVNIPLSAIKPYEKNTRTHPPAQIELLARLLREHGVDQPIVVDENGVILKGHGRLMAATKAGFEEFPVVVHRGLS